MSFFIYIFFNRIDNKHDKTDSRNEGTAREMIERTV
jgi:hypothetical protein